MGRMKVWGIYLLVLMLAFSLVACTSKSSAPETKKDVKKDGRVVIDYWHAMGGDSGKALDELVKKFNESQDKIKVNSLYQGSYEEALTKLKQVEGTKEAPSVVQLFGIGNREMIDTVEIVPVDKFIKEENYDISKIEKNILAYYTFNDKIYSMPFSTSNAIMFYNKDAFAEVGLDPENPPHTFSEIKSAAQKLVVKNGSKTDRYGFSFMIYGWLFEQLMANQGALMVNNDNGRTGKAPTEAVFNSEEGQKIMNWLLEMHKEGSSVNYGRKLDDVRTGFKTGKIAMYLDSSASIADLVNNSNFKVGTTSLPVPDGVEPQGAQLGGNSHWIMANQSKEAQKAGWEFLKFLSSAENQAFWSVNTGYFPIRSDSYDLQIIKDAYSKNPQFKTPVDQMQATKLIPATQGAAIGVIPEMRATIEDELEKIYDGSIKPKEALDEAAAKITKSLDNYNKTASK
ncbi:ABC transporter substrate-binding protein [Heyndrickxia sporothermodurans]|nr:ABC transporter substrate-binding protein [Heyndrickxia sporothermodurans]